MTTHVRLSAKIAMRRKEVRAKLVLPPQGSDGREPLSLRHHRATYPKHLIWRRAALVRAAFAARRLLDDIGWTDEEIT